MMINFIEQFVAAPWTGFDGGIAEHGKKLISGSRREGLTLRTTLELPWSSTGTVDDFVTVRASMLNANQQLSTRSVQQVQYQSITNHEFQQISITC